MQRVQLLRALVRDSQYAVDEQLIAQAIVARLAVRRLVPETVLRNDPRQAQVRSFRPSSKARSFRPCNLPSGRAIRARQAG